MASLHAGTHEAAHVCVARHGETDWNRLGILQGWFDVPLNTLGRQQAQALATSLTAAGFAALWTSPLARAAETAQIVASHLALPAPRAHEGLRERNFGAIQGIPKSELAELNPVLLEQILRRNPAAEFVGGESMDDFAERVLDAITAIGAEHRGQKVLAVTHGWVLDVVTRHILGLERRAVMHVKPQNGEVLWVEVTPKAITAQPG
ncbi:MAG: histidine phosphatase family protein [Burkholderiales bacterium]